ncbi:MAG: 2-alkenal reductase, partial [Burkholderiales bacterium PBB5]
MIFAQATTVGLAVLFVVATLKPQWLPADGPTLGAGVSRVVSLRMAAPAASGAGQGAVSTLGMAEAAAIAAPAVVSVITSQARKRNPHGD